MRSGKLDSQKQINIVVIGIASSFLVFFLIYTFFARILVSTILENLESYFALLMIFVGLELITVISSIIVGIMITDKMNQSAVLKASIMALLSNLVLLIVISYTCMWIFYPEIFNEIYGFEIIIMMPSVLIYFSIYVLGHPIFLFILSIFSYFMFFLIFLRKFN